MDNVTIRVGDLLGSQAQTLVNTVNCVGVMGKGIALAFKNRFPDMYDDYVRRCGRGEVKLGRPYLYKTLVRPQIINFPTKDHWRAVSKLSDIVAGIHYLQENYKAWGVESLAVPPLGCGNGQLDWTIVGRTLYRELQKFDIPIEFFAPHGTPDDQLTRAFLDPPRSESSSESYAFITPAAVALVSIVSYIDREPFHWPIGRVAFQKIAYFATISGIPTGLEFQRASFGPFSKSLKSLTARLVNHELVTETHLGNAFLVRPGPTYRDARERSKDWLRQWRPIIEKVADLFLRLPKTADAEIAATVHFVAIQLSDQTGSKPSEREVLNEVIRWKQRRNPPMGETEIATMIRTLGMLGWVSLKPTRDLLPIEEEIEYA